MPWFAPEEVRFVAGPEGRALWGVEVCGEQGSGSSSSRTGVSPEPRGGSVPCPRGAEAETGCFICR